jgi:hypothetical protein
MCGAGLFAEGVLRYAPVMFYALEAMRISAHL